MRLVSKALILGVALFAGATATVLGCSSGKGTGTNPEHPQTGEVGLNLTLAGGEVITSLAYNLSNGTPADTRTGTITLPTGSAGTGPFMVPTYEIVPVVAASGYTITVTGSSTDGLVTCTGASVAPFTVTAGNETIVSVLVTCTTPNNGGSVEVNATLQNCPTVSTLTAINATAATVPPGNTSTIFASATAPNASTITYAFSVTSGTGTLSGQVNASNAIGTSSSIVLTCPANPEIDTIQVVTADQTGAMCPASLTTATVKVSCGMCVGVGTGTAATPDTAAGTCPAGQSNILTDAFGNYCCAPPCYGLGTGVEATPPNSAGGLCPTGSVNTGTLQDPQLNYCCSTSPTVPYSVVRSGPATVGAAQDSVAVPVYVENHSLNFSTNVDTLVVTAPLPTAVSGTQQAFGYFGLEAASVATIPGVSINDGALSLSVTGHYLTLAGYDTVPGTSATGIVGTSRVVARLNAAAFGVSPPAGSVDTSTYFALGTTGAYSGLIAYVRGSTTIDGSGFWVGGANPTTNTTGGLWYIPFGTQGGTNGDIHGTAQLNTVDTRVVNIFNGQLYGDADVTSSVGMSAVFTCGTGTPMTAPVTDVNMAGLPMMTSSTSADVSTWQFAFVGTNTLYIATDEAVGATNPTNGISKYTLSGGTWSLATTFFLAPSQPFFTPGATQDGFRGLTVLATGGGSTTLIASTAEPPTAALTPVPQNHLAVFVDNGVYGSGGQTLNGILVQVSPLNALYRGVAPAPR